MLNDFTQMVNARRLCLSRRTLSHQRAGFIIQCMRHVIAQSIGHVYLNMFLCLFSSIVSASIVCASIVSASIVYRLCVYRLCIYRLLIYHLRICRLSSARLHVYHPNVCQYCWQQIIFLITSSAVIFTSVKIRYRISLL